MAGHTGLFATSAECIAKMGTNYNSVDVDEAMINEFCLQAENFINLVSRHNWSDHFTAPATTTTLSADVWHALGELESNLVAIYGIMYDMSSYTSNIEAEDMINVLWARSSLILNYLRDQKVVDFMTGATI